MEGMLQDPHGVLVFVITNRMVLGGFFNFSCYRYLFLIADHQTSLIKFIPRRQVEIYQSHHQQLKQSTVPG